MRRLAVKLLYFASSSGRARTAASRPASSSCDRNSSWYSSPSGIPRAFYAAPRRAFDVDQRSRAPGAQAGNEGGHMKKIVGMAAAAWLAALLALPVCAQSQKTVQGLIVNIGIMSSIDAEHSDAQHGVHKGGHGSGTQHILISLAEEKGGARVGDAQVTIELKN